jgi:hypothetical protein
MERRLFLKAGGMAATGMLFNPVRGLGSREPNLKQGDLITVNPVDHALALVNPDMGWTMHYYSNIITNYGSRLEPSDTLDDFPGLSTVYLRVPWSFIEVDEGVFHWELLDTPAQRWIDKGKKVAFRISAQESWMRYATPEWVVRAGAKGLEVEMGDKQLWEPVYDDPVFLEKAEQFVAVMAGRYDGSPHVAFVDVGHFGMWGEGHTVHTSKIEYPFEVKKRHIDIYLNHFKNTLLCISDDFAGPTEPGSHLPITDYAFSRGVTLRDDSIMVQPPPNSWYHAELAQQFWPELPVILEHEHYGSSVRRGAWSRELFLKSVEEYHASYMSIHWWPRVLLEENREVIDKINLRMGYRIQARQVSWPAKVIRGESFTIRSTWANAGVAPCYPGGFPCFTLKDQKGGIISVLVDDDFDVRDLAVGEPLNVPEREISSSFIIGPYFHDPVRTFARNIDPGSLDLYISVGTKDGTPILELPYGEDDGFKRYKLGSIMLSEEKTL